MLLKALNVVNSRGSELSLPLDDTSGGFIVKDIQGLGPAKATMVTSRFANMDGAQYHSSRTEPRNIVVKLGLAPDYGAQSVYDLRDQLYNFFMPKTAMTLKFHLFDRFSENFLTQNKHVEIVGRIESFEPEIFTNEPTVDLSIMCYSPDFLDLEPTIFEGFSHDTNFVVTMATEPTFIYDGTVDTGFTFKLFVDITLPEFELRHSTPGGDFSTIYFTETLYADDVLSIGSVPGLKHVTLLRGGVESPLLHGLSPQSPWVSILPGENYFTVLTEGSFMPYTIEYKGRYGGL